MDFNREAWERDRFGETRFHLPVPHRNVKPSLKTIRQDSVMSRASPESVGKLIALSEMLGHTDDGAQVLTWTREEVERALRKLRQNPREFFKTENESTEDDQRRFYIQRPGANTPISTTTAPRPTYGVVYSTTEGGRILGEGRWACCWQAQEEPGCYFGYKDTRRNISYTWFGGLKRFPRSDYDLIVRSSRGVVYLEDNLLACDDLHQSIVTTLTSSAVKNALFARSLDVLHADETLFILWKVAGWMHEYNAISKVPRGNFPDTFDRDYMIAYLDKHLPRQFFPLLRDATMDSKLKETIKRLKQQTELLLKKAYIEKNPWRRLDTLIKRLEQYRDADLYNLSDVDLAADLQTAGGLLQESAVFLNTAKVSTVKFDDDILAWYNRLPKQNLSESDLNNIDALIVIYRNGEEKHNENMDDIRNASQPPKMEDTRAWYKRLYNTVRKFVIGDYQEAFNGVKTVETDMKRIETLHAKTVKNLRRYLQSYLNDLDNFTDPDTGEYKKQLEALRNAYVTLDTITGEHGRLRNVYIKYANIEFAIDKFFREHVSEITGEPLQTPASADEREKVKKFLDIAKKFRVQDVIDLGTIDNNPNTKQIQGWLDAIATKDRVKNYESYIIPSIVSILDDKRILDTVPKLERVNRHIALITNVAQRRDKPESDFMKQIKQLAEMIGALKDNVWVTQWELIEEYQMDQVVSKSGTQYIVRDLKPLDKTTYPTYFGHSFQIEHTILYWDEFVAFLNRTKPYNDVQNLFLKEVTLQDPNIMRSKYPSSSQRIKTTFDALKELRRRVARELQEPSFIDTVQVLQKANRILSAWRSLIVMGTEIELPDTDDRHLSLPFYMRAGLDVNLKDIGILQPRLQVPWFRRTFDFELETFDRYTRYISFEVTNHAYRTAELQGNLWNNRNPDRKWLFSGHRDGAMYQYSKELMVKYLQFTIFMTLAIIAQDEKKQLEAIKQRDDAVAKLDKLFFSQTKEIPRLILSDATRTLLDACIVQFKRNYDFAVWENFLVKGENANFKQLFGSLCKAVQSIAFSTKEQQVWLLNLAGQCGLYDENSKLWYEGVSYERVERWIFVEQFTSVGFVGVQKGAVFPRIEMLKAWILSLTEFCSTVNTSDYSVSVLKNRVTLSDGNFVAASIPQDDQYAFKFQIGASGPQFTLFSMSKSSRDLWNVQVQSTLIIVRKTARKFLIKRPEDSVDARALQQLVDCYSLKRTTVTDGRSIDASQPDIAETEQFATPIIENV